LPQDAALPFDLVVWIFMQDGGVLLFLLTVPVAIIASRHFAGISRQR
jgi:hypothetical protein